MSDGDVYSHEWRTLDAPLPASIGGYRVLGRVADAGQGSQGTVYRGQDPETGALVAIKVLGDPLDSFAGSVLAALIGDSALEELREEARVLGLLDHPNVVAALATGEDPAQGAYLVTEWVAGGSLRARLERQGRLPPGQAVAVCRGILAALAAAHGAGLLHRDVKPENVLLDEAGRARLTDFGIAASFGAVSGGQAGRGTPGYMAPEQRDPERWQEVSPATDLYAAGVVLAEMLTGARPAPDARVDVSGVPADLRDVIERALDPDPRRRFASAREMASALADYRE